jgi:hypothetical protein
MKKVYLPIQTYLFTSKQREMTRKKDREGIFLQEGVFRTGKDRKTIDNIKICCLFFSSGM